MGRLRVTVVEERVQVFYWIWKMVQIGRLARLKCFAGDRDKFIVNTLINFEVM